MRAEAVREFERFEETVERLLATDGVNTVYAYFFGNLQADTGKSWCPDCVQGDPIIRKTLSEHDPEAVLLECPSGERAVYVISSFIFFSLCSVHIFFSLFFSLLRYRAADHVYRTHPLIQLKAVPTVIKWTKEGPKGRLVEDECFEADNLLKLTSSN
ncbi:Thioredoxin domain-containing protein 17 [Balamuthia mandrillaris]